MDFLAEVLASFTPYVLFGAIGGFVGGLFGIDKQEYGLKISAILLFIAAITGASIGETLHNSYSINSLFLLCCISFPAGAVSGFLMDALKTASPSLAAKVVDKVSSNAIKRIPGKDD